MGTMVRSAQALGGKGVLALKSTVSAFNPKAVRASAGAIFRLPVVQGLEPRSLFDRLRHAGVRPQLANACAEWLRQCAAAEFAPGTTNAAPPELAQGAENLLSALEREGVRAYRG